MGRGEGGDGGELDSDVRAFASSLGFTSNGGTDGPVARGFDDRDFRAAHLKKKAAAAKKTHGPRTTTTTTTRRG